MPTPHATFSPRTASAHPNLSRSVKRIPSPIPDKAWYLTPPAIAFVGGLLPFGSIFIEMYFIFTSFWNYKVRRLVLVLPCNKTVVSGMDLGRSTAGRG